MGFFRKGASHNAGRMYILTNKNFITNRDDIESVHRSQCFVHSRPSHHDGQGQAWCGSRKEKNLEKFLFQFWEFRPNI